MHVILSGNCDIDEAAERVSAKVLNKGITSQLVARSEQEIAGGKVILLMFEKYFLRASNEASLTVMLVSQGGSVRADVVGAGANANSIAGFSFGAEERFVKTAVAVLNDCGIT